MSRFIYIKGHSAVDTAAIAKLLCDILPNSIIFPHGVLLDKATANIEKSDEGNAEFRQSLVDSIGKVLSIKSPTPPCTWILAVQTFQNPLETSYEQAFKDAAERKGLSVLSVFLNWGVGVDERSNLTRTKNEVVEMDLLRNTNDHLSGDTLEIDVTGLAQVEAAQALCHHIDSKLPESRTVLPRKTFLDVPGFKHEFIANLKAKEAGYEVHQLLCWLISRPRHHGAILFFDVGDSTGSIQVVARKSTISTWDELRTLTVESSLTVWGTLSITNESAEIVLDKSSIISKSTGQLHPEIRKLDTDLLTSNNTDKVLSSRHLYLRNPLIMALNLYRSRFFSVIHQWFNDNRFVEISAPLITPSILYEPNSAVHLTNLKSNKTLFLSQCAGFYLEAAAHAHERVYNLGPSFRNESRTNRHLMEYWHIKAELCSGRINDIMDLVEIFLKDIYDALLPFTQELTKMMGSECPGIQIPFKRITYVQALKLLNEQGFEIAFGQNISKRAEDMLTSYFGGSLWITHKPRELEPFPYSICVEDERLTMTADLISSGGFGEICGVAEKSYTRGDLETRMKEKGKMEQMEIYSWVLESRDFGMAPHTAFGMGFERVLRWFCGLPHVKDAIPFPRIFGRDPIP